MASLDSLDPDRAEDDEYGADKLRLEMRLQARAASDASRQPTTTAMRDLSRKPPPQLHVLVHTPCSARTAPHRARVASHPLVISILLGTPAGIRPPLDGVSSSRRFRHGAPRASRQSHRRLDAKPTICHLGVQHPARL